MTQIAEAPEVFDYVVCGAGSAGCVLANRLSDNGRYQVALIEAGGRDNWIWFHIPAGYLFAIGNPRADWLFRTEKIAGLNGRDLAYPRGKVLGGSSAINAMIYMRGQREDYDSWRDRGLDGWGWEDVLPTFIRHEDNWRGRGPFHGAGGEWRVEPPRLRWEILDAFREAAAQCEIPPTDDFNTGSNEGCGYFDVNQKRGRRWSAARGFLKPALKRPNLHLISESLIDRIVFDGRLATGVVIRGPGGERTIRARREIVLAAGAVGSPAILERSGIGNGRRLRALGIEVTADLPGVGENLQDHLQIRPVFKVEDVPTMNTIYRSLIRRGVMGLQYAFLRRGALTMAPSQLGAFTRSDRRHDRPNIQFHVQPLSLDKFGDALHDFGAITVSVCNLRPTSRGSIHILSADPAAAPAIDPNYLSTEEDRLVAAESIRKAREIMQAEALGHYSPSEHLPGTQYQTDAELAAIAGNIATTIFHPVGTARMGPENDTGAVVDARLKVRNVEGLRVADASVMPTITSGNTNSPTMVIAEKASEFIQSEA
ncbi:MAG: GMC family oxidoreductase N-terminal domain-containing protein [Mesorhizobium sp.]|nr:GMC family oxidoreductase N-terminal domain-containing protein [Mesorhizobium sp.]MCO5162498.1 GMC family oxidoreductase N-terminal domain-containing protein [Mesorhizobium sp.]